MGDDVKCCENGSDMEVSWVGHLHLDPTSPDPPLQVGPMQATSPIGQFKWVPPPLAYSSCKGVFLFVSRVRFCCISINICSKYCLGDFDEFLFVRVYLGS